MNPSALVVGSQYNFLDVITRNGVIWDLTGATVTIYFKRPDATTFSFTGTLTTPTSGQVSYQCATTDLNQAGQWTRAWKVVLNGVTYWTVPTSFQVVVSP